MSTAISSSSLADQAISETITRALAKYPQHAARIKRGAELLSAGAVRRLSEGRYSVRASNGERSYTVHMLDNGKATCECPDAANRGRGCKHAWAAWLHGIAAERFTVLSARQRTPDPSAWSPEEAKRLMFVRWLVTRRMIGEGN